MKSERLRGRRPVVGHTAERSHKKGLSKFLILSAYACRSLAGCQDIQDSDAENANSRETSIKRANETETLVALFVRVFFYNAALRLLNIESFLQFNGALLCQVKPSFSNTRVLKDEPSLVFSFYLYLPYASEVIVTLLDDGKQRLNPQNSLAVRH